MKKIDSPELLSIITPVLNNVKDIEVCLMSVVNQSYTHKEHWIIDGDSTDGTLEIIKEYAQKYNHIKWVSEKDNGIYNAINKGIDKATGSWLYFLGSDDRLISNTIFEKILTHHEFLNYDMLYGNILLKETGIVEGKITNINGLKYTCTHHQSTFIRKHVFNTLGKYDIKYHICADWAFTIKCFQNKEIKIKYIDKVIAVYSTIGISKSFMEQNPRLRDKNFNSDFIGLFNHFNFFDKLQLLMNDHLPKYLNPIKYISYLSKLKNKYLG